MTQFRYRILPEDEWEKVHPLMSYAQPGVEVHLDPERQGVLVAEDATGAIVCALILSNAWTQTLICPTRNGADALIPLGDMAAALLPEHSMVYTYLPEVPESDELASELGLRRETGIALYVSD